MEQLLFILLLKKDMNKLFKFLFFNELNFFYSLLSFQKSNFLEKVDPMVFRPSHLKTKEKLFFLIPFFSKSIFVTNQI